MNELETLDIMQSDMKLWDTAETKNHGDGRVTKTLSLPWGIGELQVTMEGLTDATKRRDAVAQFGAYIRSEIEERRDDDAVTARAQAAAARAEQAGGGNSTGLSSDGGLRDETGEAAALQGAGEAHEETPEVYADFGATIIARAAKIEERLRILEEEQARLAVERDGIEAALLAMGYTR